jgi:hypothetical protein
MMQPADDLDRKNAHFRHRSRLSTAECTALSPFATMLLMADNAAQPAVVIIMLPA